MIADEGYDRISFGEIFILILETFLYSKCMIKLNPKLNYGVIGTSIHSKESV